LSPTAAPAGWRRKIPWRLLFTRDDVPIIAHHYDLSDYGIPADLSRLTLAEAQQLDVGSWFSPEFRDQRIPSVAEALDFLRGKVDRVYLHDKKENEYGGPGRRRIEILAEVIRRSGMQDRVVVMVEGSDLELWSELAPDIAVLKCWTAPRTARGSFSLADGFGLGLRHFGIYHGARGLRWHGELLYRLGLRRLGLYVGRWPTRAEVAGDFTVFTLNDEYVMRLYLDAGFRAIGTDDPTLLLSLIHSDR
jgi:glycerophosphoryl diester phosphodiesterase